uniref:Restriction endonuclease n=1 Tax=Candidatus Kentrum sp. FW TaxID=2126338 RepID=A0A450SB27_9GAMM|nr:MAG: Putative restriction endonuclease [Candidatus Kentron sp. FW]
MQWSEVLEHKELQDLPFKIELNEWGNIVMSPASNRHAFIQTMLANLIDRRKKEGFVLTECSIGTSWGVKVADVIWGSDDFFSRNGLVTPYSIAPEVCIEVLSPSNTMKEMIEKKELYFARGAREVWLCKESGEMIFFDNHGEIARSGILEEIPVVLHIAI